MSDDYDFERDNEVAKYIREVEHAAKNFEKRIYGEQLYGLKSAVAANRLIGILLWALIALTLTMGGVLALLGMHSWAAYIILGASVFLFWKSGRMIKGQSGKYEDEIRSIEKNIEKLEETEYSL